MHLTNQPKEDNGTIASVSKHYLVYAFRDPLKITVEIVNAGRLDGVHKGD